MIISCPNCKSHPFQDSKYGANNRVHNQHSGSKKWTCTVCSKEKSETGRVIDEGKKKK